MVRAGIDLGAHSLRLVLDKEGLVYDEPAIAAFNEKGDILAIGRQAFELQSSTSEKIRLVRPITPDHLDVEALEAMLNELCYEFRLFRLFQKTALLVCYPSRFDEPTIERLKATLGDLGADELYFDQEIWLAAVGSGLDLFLPVSSCVLSLGFSNCDLAVFRSGKLEHRMSSSVFNGQRAFEMIRQWIASRHYLNISDETLDYIVLNIGSVKLRKEDRGMQVQGIDVDSGASRSIVITANEIATALAPFAREVGLWVSSFLEGLPANIRLDLHERGIVASGGTMKIAGLAEQIATLADCPVYVTDDPDRTVARGLEALLETISI